MFEIKSSAIHGKGLFATQRIALGAVIGVVEGRPTRDDGPHVLWLTDELGLHVINDMRYINHCSDPNAAYYDDGEVIALRDILPGQEITHNYDSQEDPDQVNAWD